MPAAPLRPPLRVSTDPASTLVIRNVVVAGHRTSVRLEPQMWDALQEIVQVRGMTLNQLVTEIAHERSASSLTAAIRVYIVDFFREAAQRHDRPPPRPLPI